ncbi:MAG TPA: hypothetical protein VIE89_30990 [Candidatus Binatia bacterium]
MQSLTRQVRPSALEPRVNAHGFSLHAALRWRADQRLELEQLYRYITRPAIANEWLKLNRLVALVPRPRLHLIRFHGVLVPNAKLRIQIVPAPPERAAETSSENPQVQSASARISWARLLKWVFDIDVEHCPNCGGSLKIIAAIEDPPIIVKILTHLDLPTRAPPRAPARRVDLFQTI